MQPLSLCESTLVRLLLLCAKSSNNGILLSKVFLSPVIKLYAPFAGKKQHFRLIKCLELEKLSFEMGGKEKICIAKEALLCLKIPKKFSLLSLRAVLL